MTWGHFILAGAIGLGLGLGLIVGIAIARAVGRYTRGDETR